MSQYAAARPESNVPAIKGRTAKEELQRMQQQTCTDASTFIFFRKFVPMLQSAAASLESKIKVYERQAECLEELDRRNNENAHIHTPLLARWPWSFMIVANTHTCTKLIVTSACTNYCTMCTQAHTHKTHHSTQEGTRTSAFGSNQPQLYWPYNLFLRRISPCKERNTFQKDDHISSRITLDAIRWILWKNQIRFEQDHMWRDLVTSSEKQSQSERDTIWYNFVILAGNQSHFEH